MVGVVACAGSLPACQSREMALHAEPQAETTLTATASAAGSVPDQSRPAAVLELFTSEGCSSCPPADETLAQLTREAEASGRRVITLELHVDYWNYLGWVDPFSNEQYSWRQESYAHHFAATGVYTPQLIVNGREQLVGSDGTGARAAIERALAMPATAQVSFEAQRRGDGVDITYRVNAPGHAMLQLAAADDAAETRVTRGENASQLLRHRHVVRAFHSVPVEGATSGAWHASWPAGKPRGGVFVAAYLTDPSTLSVLGAEERSLHPEG